MKPFRQLAIASVLFIVLCARAALAVDHPSPTNEVVKIQFVEVGLIQQRPDGLNEVRLLKADGKEAADVLFPEEGKKYIGNAQHEVELYKEKKDQERKEKTAEAHKKHEHNQTALKDTTLPPYHYVYGTKRVIESKDANAKITRHSVIMLLGSQEIIRLDGTKQYAW